MLREAEEFKKSLGNLLLIDDWEAVDIFLAVVAAHKLGGNMFWVRLIGASGSGKSELLKSLQAHSDYAISADTFTPGAIRGGLDSEGKTKLPRMLESWNNKLVLTKDFASVISKKKEDRGEVFGLLRNAWDGTLDAFYGTKEGLVHLEFSFDWILASTPYIEHQRSLEAELGSRFIDIRWNAPEDKISAILRAGDNDKDSNELRKDISYKMGEFLQKCNFSSNSFNDKKIAELAQAASTCRTPVSRGNHGVIYDLPTPELATRLYMGMRRIAIGLIKIGIEDYSKYMIRIALDCLPRLRRICIEEIAKNNKATQLDISEIAKVSQSTVNTAIEDLRLLGFTKDQSELFRI